MFYSVSAVAAASLVVAACVTTQTAETESGSYVHPNVKVVEKNVAVAQADKPKYREGHKVKQISGDGSRQTRVVTSITGEMVKHATSQDCTWSQPSFEMPVSGHTCDEDAENAKFVSGTGSIWPLEVGNVHVYRFDDEGSRRYRTCSVVDALAVETPYYSGGVFEIACVEKTSNAPGSTAPSCRKSSISSMSMKSKDPKGAVS